MDFLAHDGSRYSGATPREVVQAMAEASFNDDEKRDLPTFMGRTAIRVRRFQGVSLPADTPERFLAALVEHGILKPAPSADGQ